MGTNSTFKHALTFGAVVTAAALALTGCAGGAPAADDDTISFVTWTGGDAGKKWEALAAAYEEATGVTVEIEIVPSETFDQVISSRIEAGNAPDLIETITEKQEAWVGAGLLTDLSDQAWVTEGIPAVQGFADYFDGKTYAFIPAIDVAGVFYNVDLFDELGLEVPETWEDFESVVAALNAAGVTPLAVGAKDGWPLNVQANQMGTGALAGSAETLELRDGERTFTDSTWSDILTDWSDLIAQGAYDPQVLGIDWPSSAVQFGEGGAGMMIQGSFALPAIRETAPDMNVGMFPLPYPVGGELIASVSYGSMLAIPSGAPNADGAKELLDFIADPANLATFLADAKAFSGIVGVTPELDPSLEAIAALIETSSAEYNLAGGTSAAVNAAIAAGVQGLIGGTMTVEDVLASMDRAQADG